MLSGVFWTVLILDGVLCAGSDVVSVSVKEGDPVTLHSDFKITKQHKIGWYIKNTRIAGIDLFNGESCTDVQCNEGAERFRDRLKLDHQTGDLTIINTRITDSGEYKLEVISNDDDGEETFSVTVYSVSAADKHEMNNIPEETDASNTDSALSSGAVTGICVTSAVVLLVNCAGVFYLLWKKQHVQTEESPSDIPEQELPMI